jgi:hypothetical protein
MTSCLKYISALLIAACVLWNAAQAAPLPGESIVSDGAIPEVAYLLSPQGTELQLQLRVEELQAGLPSPVVRLGLNTGRTIFLESSERNSVRNGTDWVFTFPLEDQLARHQTWRWAIEVSWSNSAGTIAVRQNFFVPPHWAEFYSIGDASAAWNEFNLTDYRQQQNLQKHRLKIDFPQPVDGKATVVIEDANGHRIRNLLMGQSMTQGVHELVWDGLDESGNLVQPGNYKWRAISHPDITPELLTWFYNPGKAPWSNEQDAGWLADHSNPIAATSNDSYLAFGAPVAESGHNIILLDKNGNKRAHADLSWFVGSGELHLAMDAKHLYAFSEGFPHYGHTAKDKDGREYTRGELILLRWDLNGKRLPYSGKQGEARLRDYRRATELLSEGSKGFSIGNIRGVVFLDGKLFVSLHNENLICILDPDQGVEVGSIEIASPGPIATDGQNLYVLSDNGQVTRITSPTIQPSATPLLSVELSEPLTIKDRYNSQWPVATALAVDQNERLLVADNGIDQNIKVYSLENGKLAGELGPRGGRASSGQWNPDTLRMPYGMTIDADGLLWVVENEGVPRRISVWDIDQQSCTKEYLGPSSYGAPGAGFDPQDASRWIAGGMLWDLNLDSGQSKLLATLHHKDKKAQLSGSVLGDTSDTNVGTDCQIIHYQGRTFYLTKARFLKIFELLPNGSVQLWAALGDLDSFEATDPRWAVPEIFTQHPMLKDELSHFTRVTGAYKDLRTHSKPSPQAKEYIILWTDVNGDEIAQVEELQVSKNPRQLATPYWSTLNFDLDLVFAMREGSHWLRTKMPLHGFLPSGAPDWKLADSLTEAVPIEGYEASSLQSTMVDSQNRLLINANPMAAVDESGQLLWQMQNKWTGVHGSHLAPLPHPGLLQGSLSFLGRAAYDTDGDLTVINGNHGRFFILTTDGIYIDEIFEDVRVALSNNPQRIGGEPFGGYFGQDPATGDYLLQSGHRAFQIYRLNGLKQLQRSEGTLEVSPEQITAAQKLLEAQQIKPAVLGAAELAIVPRDAALTTPESWPVDWTAEWGDASRPFPHTRVKAIIQGNRLHLGYEVKDPSPWLNYGTDSQLLFKTGDAVDFKFATDPNASPTRATPVAGDRRLLIANFQGKPVAVLYDYVIPGSQNPVTFNSPWRAAKVDQVSLIEDAIIEISKQGDRYSLTASIPLVQLGLDSLSAGQPLRADFGVIYSDQEGRSNTLRSYWANPATGLVNDVPGETMINPSLWGELRIVP